jgi:hypothetical protein
MHTKNYTKNKESEMIIDLIDKYGGEDKIVFGNKLRLLLKFHTKRITKYLIKTVEEFN